MRRIRSRDLPNRHRRKQLVFLQRRRSLRIHDGSVVLRSFVRRTPQRPTDVPEQSGRRRRIRSRRTEVSGRNSAETPEQDHHKSEAVRSVEKQIRMTHQKNIRKNESNCQNWTKFYKIFWSNCIITKVYRRTKSEENELSFEKSLSKQSRLKQNQNSLTLVIRI